MQIEAILRPYLAPLSRQARTGLVWSAALLLVAIVGFIDYRTSYEVNVVLFYSAPILLMVWLADRISAVFMALLCAIVWWWADIASGHIYTQEWYQVWETVVRLIYFLLFVVGGSAIKSRLELLEHNQHLEHELIRISEREQQRIGRDLHDGICQYFAAIGCAAGSLKRNLDKQSLPQASRAGEIEELIMKGVAQTRGLARGLFPVENTESGLTSALEELAARSSQLLGVQCTCEFTSPAPIFDNSTATHLYRIAQEAVSNAARHGKAQHVAIGLAANPREVSLSITDDGTGLPAQPIRKPGLGLGIMQYRARIIDARFAISANPAGSGTMVRCYFTQES
jgi:signal transduction histidine kinase